MCTMPQIVWPLSACFCEHPSWLVCISRLLLHSQSQQRKHGHTHIETALNTHVTISKYPIAADFSADTEGSRKSLLLYVVSDCFVSGGSKCQEDFGKQPQLHRRCRATAEGPPFRYVFNLSSSWKWEQICQEQMMNQLHKWLCRSSVLHRLNWAEY